ncbi:MAG: hypothetical protein H0X24_11630 [Ktedonobacterales bacterium]|nr:hypothetical protein [Ktedonobacterales bacterium]
MPMRTHQRRLDGMGCPEWSWAFAQRMRAITAPDWWVFDPIITPLRNTGYGLGVEVVRGLHGKTAVQGGIHVLCRLLRISYPTAKRHFKRSWDAAYSRFHAQYPGVIEHPYYEELWRRVAYSDRWEAAT